MRRRQVLVALTVLAAGPVHASAQPSRPHRVAVLAMNPRSAPHLVAFVERMRELGHVEGQNLLLDFRSAQGRADRAPQLAAELVRSAPEVILATGPELSLKAVTEATRTIPVVMVALNYDPLAKGYVAGLARPGGNVTGIFYQQLEQEAKRLDLFREAFPKVTRIAVLFDEFNLDQLRSVEASAPSTGLLISAVRVPPSRDYDAAFAEARRAGAGGVLVLGSPIAFRERARLGQLALKHRLPGIGGVNLELLLGYGPGLEDILRRAADYVDRILKGARPGDLPVEQPTRFELVINARQARALGVTLPQSIVVRADRVIE